MNLQEENASIFCSYFSMCPGIYCSRGSVQKGENNNTIVEPCVDLYILPVRSFPVISDCNFKQHAQLIPFPTSVRKLCISHPLSNTFVLRQALLQFSNIFNLALLYSNILKKIKKKYILLKSLILF